MLLQRQTPLLRPLTTAHLAQTMTLLELSAMELRQKIEAELASNPALELLEEFRCPKCGRILRGKGFCPTCTKVQDASPERPIVFLSPREDFFTHRGKKSSPDEEASEEDYSAEVENLPQFVLRQVAPELEPDERPIAAHILTSLDEDGLLTIPIMEIARYRAVPISKVIKVIQLIQHAEPLGVGSSHPQEALLVQLEVLSETQPVPELAYRAVKEGMDLLSRRKFIELAHLLKISVAEAKHISHFIGENLNPYPARTHWGEVTSRQPDGNRPNGAYYFPDVIISRLNDHDDTPLVVEIALPLNGTLRINPLFREALHHAPDDKAEQWKTDLEQAGLLVKCLQQRNHTMVRMLEILTVIQREFILNGDGYLQPLTRASLAVALDLHESTISRAVSDKAVQLPNGRITPFARFFDRSLHIRTALKRIIEKETKPLSDAAIAKLLTRQGHPVARRTVAKYRSMEGILPAHLRLHPQA